MLRTLAIIFGIIFLAMGILGFIPKFTPDQNLLGYFHVNPLHNLIHIISGIIAIWMGFVSGFASKIFFQTLGIVYAIFAGFGFYYGNAPLFGLIANNWPDTFLHLFIAIAALFIGFKMNVKKKELS